MPLWLLDIGVVLALLAATQLMFRRGRATRARYDETAWTQITTVQAATLGMLALVLGFTLSMAEARFNGRRQILALEAEAVGTTYLRTDFLPEPERSESRDLLVDYIAARHAYYRASREEAPAATARSQAIHRELWTRAAAVGRAHPDWDLFATYIESLNEMIELEARRDLAITSRLPAAIHVLLVMVALIAVGVTGFATGLMGPRSSLTLYIVPLLIALSCGVVADLDRSRVGFIHTTDRPMERLQRTLAVERAAP